MLHFPSPGVDGHRAFLTAMKHLVIDVFSPPPLLFWAFAFLGQAFARKMLRRLEEVTFCCLGL